MDFVKSTPDVSFRTEPYLEHSQDGSRQVWKQERRQGWKQEQVGEGGEELPGLTEAPGGGRDAAGDQLHILRDLGRT